MKDLAIGTKVDVKIGFCHYEAIILDIDRLGSQLKLGWMPEDEAFGDESWWPFENILVRAI